MAARTVNCYFKNLTDQSLERESDELDWGIYTDPWYPPQTIAPGAVGEWRSESDGGLIPQGTEGRARYRIASTEARTEFIDLWWNITPTLAEMNRTSVSLRTSLAILVRCLKAPSKLAVICHRTWKRC